MNKKFFYITFLFLQFAFHIGFAQNRGSKVESIKIAFLSERLNLDPRTAERFWPVYNQYDDEMRRILQESKRANDTRSAEQILDQEQKAIDVKRKYSVLFLKVISNEQLSQLFQAEKDFNKMLLRRMNKIEQRDQLQQNNGDIRERRMSGGRRQEAMNSEDETQKGSSLIETPRSRFRKN